jgi:predicted RNA-binding Zn-ribbon protein involved in translation (DUF1610 family)
MSYPRLVIIGNPFEGYTYHGPFDTFEAAEEYAEAVSGGGSEWWVGDLQLVAVKTDDCPPQGIQRPILDMSGPQRNADAAETASQVACPYCGQPAGQACITARKREATFTHMDRIHARLNEMTRQTLLMNHPTEQQPDACPSCRSIYKHIVQAPCSDGLTAATVERRLVPPHHAWHDAASRAVRPEWMDDKDFVG